MPNKNIGLGGPKLPHHELVIKNTGSQTVNVRILIKVVLRNGQGNYLNEKTQEKTVSLSPGSSKNETIWMSTANKNNAYYCVEGFRVLSVNTQSYTPQPQNNYNSYSPQPRRNHNYSSQNKRSTNPLYNANWGSTLRKVTSTRDGKYSKGMNTTLTKTVDVYYPSGSDTDIHWDTHTGSISAGQQIHISEILEYVDTYLFKIGVLSGDYTPLFIRLCDIE